MTGLGPLRRAALAAGLVVMRVTVRVVPSRRIAVVHGFPDSEESSLRVVGELGHRLPAPWQVVLLCDDPARADAAFRLVQPGRPVPRLVRRISLRGFALAAVARLWVHTHGLYGSPHTSRRRLHVLIGHGHGPKRATPRQVRAGHHADLAFTNVAVWGQAIIAELGVPSDTPIVVTASARSDGLCDPPDPAPAWAPRPYVVWLPTVRRTVAMRRGQWQDGRRLADDADVAAGVRRLVAAADRHGLDLIAKVHELDADAADFTALGVRVVTSADLARRHVAFSHFVHAARAMITDYSSVFVDHLQTGLSIGFWMPDLAEFLDSRGLNEPDPREVAPELILHDHVAVDDLLRCAARGTTWQAEARDRLADAAGYVPGDGHAAQTMVTEILRRLMA